MKREHKLKIIAFLIAATLWYLIVWGKPVERIIEVPLKFKNSFGIEYFIEANPSTVSIKIVATRSQLRNIDKDKILVELDLGKYPPGIHQVRIPTEKILLPNNIKVKEVSPNFVTVIIKKISLKQVPVKVNLKETSEQKMKRLKLLIKPSVVTIKGFWDDLKEIEEIYTEEFSPQELKKERILEVNLHTPPKVLEVYPDRVKIIYLNP